MPILKSQLRSYAKIVAVVTGAVVVLFFFVDDVVMPRYVQQGKTTRVPSVVGLPLEEAKRVLAESGVEAKEAEFKPDKQYPVGTVVQQVPPADSDVKFGRGVYLTISGGEVLVVVPSLRGRSIRDATFNLEKYGLKLGEIQYEPSDEFFENTVISQGIPAETKVRNGSYVGLTVSQGRTANKQAVPRVVMKTLAEAEKILTQAGFKIGSVSYQVSLDLLPNTVLDQYPKGGELAVVGQPVDLFVAQKADRRPTLEN